MVLLSSVAAQYMIQSYGLASNDASRGVTAQHGPPMWNIWNAVVGETQAQTQE